MNRDDWRRRCEAELGKPYIWGAEGPDAYDCSGFSQFALALINLDPPGDQTANGLYRYFSLGRSKRVLEIPDAVLGDLVFFGTEEGITHVALAWGGGRMIEAGGGGHKTTSVAIARKQMAEVRINVIARRHDVVAILRPNELPWAGGAVEAEAVHEAVVGPSWGRFAGLPPLTEWLSDGRHMQLKRPFGYVGVDEREWPVPSETIVDGASIPRVFWSLIGGPFEGYFRNASIVHDHYCVIRTRPWRDVHRMFHDAMLCGGVPNVKARVMYYAVYRFGPRWTIGPPLELAGFAQTETASSVPTSIPTEAFDVATFTADAEQIRERALDLDAIEALADARAGRGPSVVLESAVPPEMAGAESGSGLESVTADVDAGLARLPLLKRLIALQDSANDELSSVSVGTLLSRYSAAERSEAAGVELESVGPTFEDLKPEYETLYASCRILAARRSEVVWYRDRLTQYRPHYEIVAKKAGIPWWFIGVVHALEASFNFKAHLHNGDPLSERTVQVPKGRPSIWNPPNDWESSAIDALIYEKIAGLTDWSLAAALYRWEKYNGMGYHPKGINSPYLWSYSNHYSRGKFVRDGRFDPDATSRQCGAAIMLLALEEVGVVKP